MEEKSLFMEPFDSVVVGAGFSGATFAQTLAAWGKKVLLIDRRPHLAGTAYDEFDEYGIRVGRYGPHILNIGNVRTLQYLNSFGHDLVNFEHRVFASVQGQLVPFPINLKTINDLLGTKLRNEEECRAYLAKIAVRKDRIKTSEDYVVSKIGRELFGYIYENYTAKQWGRPPSELGPEVAGRIPIHYSHEHYYYGDEKEFMPRHGFTRLVERMVDSKNIRFDSSTDFRDIRRLQSVKRARLIYTGALDELFDYEFGKLPYRTTDFKFETRFVQRVQKSPVMNFPDKDVPYTRRSEFKLFPFDHKIDMDEPITTLVTEYPREYRHEKDLNEPLYPIPQQEYKAMHAKYKAKALAKGYICGGRLGEYRYQNIHEVIPAALRICADLLGLQSWWQAVKTSKLDGAA